MSFAEANVSHLVTDTTTFRAWGTAFAAALEAAGLIKTADTGQIDWATVTFATSTSVSRGYEIRRFNDTLQATKPIFVKITYGNPAAAGGVSLNVQFGVGSNGTGSLTGSTFQFGSTMAASGVLSLYNAVPPIATSPLRPIWTSYDSGRVTVHFGANIDFMSNDGCGFGIQRTVDEAGVPTNEGFFVICAFNGTNGMLENYYEFTSATWRGVTYFRQDTGDGISFPLLPPFGQSGIFGYEVNALPYIPVGRRGYMPSLPDWIFVHEAAMGIGEEQVFEHLGVATAEFKMVGGAPIHMAGTAAAAVRDWRWCIRCD